MQPKNFRKESKEHENSSKENLKPQRKEAIENNLEKEEKEKLKPFSFFHNLHI